MGDHSNSSISVFLLFGGPFIRLSNKKGVFLKVHFMLVAITRSFTFGAFSVNNHMVIYNGTSRNIGRGWQRIRTSRSL